MNKEILAKIDEIKEYIESTNEYQNYLKLKEQIDSNQELKSLIEEIKKIQKDIVHGQKRESELKEKELLLNNNPLYREYLNNVYEVNNMYAIIENTLNNYFNDKLN